MIIFFAGDVHGQIQKFYEKVEATERQLGVTADWIVQTGNFGCWPDPGRVDRNTRKHSQQGDFAWWYVNQKPVPRRTIFVPGRHEDHRWLNFKISRGELELLPSLTLLVNGYKTTIGNDETRLSIVGLGKVFSPVAYTGKIPEKRKLGRYTITEVQRATSQGPVDLFLAHQGPHGVRFGYHVSKSLGINNICYATRPQMLVHGHYNHSKEYVTPTSRILAQSLSNMEISPWEWNGKAFIYMQ